MLWCYRGVACNTSVAFGMCAYFASLVAQTCVCMPRRLGSSGLRGRGFYNLIIGVWHSLVVRLVRDQEAVGSNPVTPTKIGFESNSQSLFSLTSAMR